MDDSVQDLIAGCRKRYRQSQLAMYRRFAPLVYPICLRIVGNAPEAEEAMQDTFLKIFDKLDQYHDELCFVAWIRRIHLNNISNIALQCSTYFFNAFK